MAEDLLNWNEKEISFFYSGAGFEVGIKPYYCVMLASCFWQLQLSVYESFIVQMFIHRSFWRLY